MRGAVAAVLLLCACAGRPVEPAGTSVLPAPLAAAPTRDLAQDLAAPSLRGLLANLDVLPTTTGLVRMLHGPTACAPKGGVNPYVVLPDRMPRVGERLELRFVTRHGGNAPSTNCWLISSFRPMPAPIDWTQFGLRGCWQLVNAEGVLLVPTAATPGGVVWRDRGDVWFGWTPPVGATGTRLWLQLLVASPADKGGFLLSPAVEITVGSAAP